MRFRRWLYVGAGCLAGIVFLGAWLEQISGLSRQVGRELWFDFGLTWIAFFIAVLTAPLALYDYLRWLFRRHTQIGSRVAGISVLGIGFWSGFSMTGWDGCIPRPVRWTGFRSVLREH